MLPQGSSFGICKAELFGDKRAVRKTVEKGGLERLMGTHSIQEQASLPQHPGCMGGSPTARDNPRFRNPLLGG